MQKKQKEYDTIKEELADLVKTIQENEQTKSQLGHLFNVTNDVDISSVSESEKASGCPTPMVDNI